MNLLVILALWPAAILLVLPVVSALGRAAAQAEESLTEQTRSLQLQR